MTDAKEDQDQEAGIRLTGLEFIEGRNSGPAWLRKIYEDLEHSWEPYQAQSILPRWDQNIEEQAESIFGKARSDIKYVIWEESGTALSSDGHERWETRYDDQGRVSYHGHIMDGAGDDRASEVDLRKRELRRADPGGV